MAKDRMEEMMLRKQAAIYRSGLEEVNKLLIERGYEPEPDTIINNAKVTIYGIKAKAGSLITNVGQAVKDTISGFKEAGLEAQEEAEVRAQVKEQTDKLIAEIKTKKGSKA